MNKMPVTLNQGLKPYQESITHKNGIKWHIMLDTKLKARLLQTFILIMMMKIMGSFLGL